MEIAVDAEDVVVTEKDAVKLLAAEWLQAGGPFATPRLCRALPGGRRGGHWALVQRTAQLARLRGVLLRHHRQFPALRPGVAAVVLCREHLLDRPQHSGGLSRGDPH